MLNNNVIADKASVPYANLCWFSLKLVWSVDLAWLVVGRLVHVWSTLVSRVWLAYLWVQLGRSRWLFSVPELSSFILASEWAPGYGRATGEGGFSSINTFQVSACSHLLTRWGSSPESEWGDHKGKYRKRQELGPFTNTLLWVCIHVVPTL